MKVPNGKKLFASLRYPLCRLPSTTLWAVAVSARVVRDLMLPATGAFQHMSTELSRSALHQRIRYFVLGSTYSVGLLILQEVLPKHIGYFHLIVTERLPRTGRRSSSHSGTESCSR